MNERKNNLFKQVPAPKVSRNMFDLSHEVKMSGKFGYLYPILCVDTLPGDSMRDTMNILLRFAPLLSPVMHRCDVVTHFFFVPNRIITDHWEDFITGGQDGTEAPILPFITPDNVYDVSAPAQAFIKKGSLWDYLGLPVMGAGAATDDEQISVLPFRAAAKVWNDFYRDPNLDVEKDLDVELAGDVSVQSVTSGILDITKYRRGFEKDYFTSALPWAQRGAEVLMPLAGTGTVTYKDGANVTTVFNADDTNIAVGGAMTLIPGPGNGAFVQNPGETKYVQIENIDQVIMDASSVSINDFRRALAIQRWLEANARGGARYVEQIEGHFDVRVPDYRLQRAEYLGGGKQPVSISEIITTSHMEGMSNHVPGEMVGHGISVGKTNRFSYRCQEHGFVIGFLSVTMRTAYGQGINRMWTRQDKFDYAWPELANLGEQEILSKELFYSFVIGDTVANNTLFGYTPRYAEYKFQNDRIAGDFRDNLGFWHLGRKFTSRPSLDINFTTIFEDGDSQEETFRRIFAVQDGTDYLWMQLYHHLTAKRPLPYFGVPKII